MKLHYIVTEGAYLDFNVYHFERSESVRKLIWRYRILIPAVWSLLAVGFSVARYYVSGRVLITYPAFFIALAALWYFLYPFFYWRSFKKRLKALVTEGFGSEAIGDVTLELLGDHLRGERGGMVSEIAYSNIEKLVEHNEHLYIYISSSGAFIVPLIAFDDKTPYRAFRNNLEEKMRAAQKAG